MANIDKEIEKFVVIFKSKRPQSICLPGMQKQAGEI